MQRTLVALSLVSAALISCGRSREHVESKRTTQPLTFEAASFDVGETFACALDVGGGVNCWGANGSGQGKSPPGAFVQVDAGQQHACGIRPDGTLACWGTAGAGTSTPPSGTFTMTSSGGSSCAIRTDGTLACWGYGGDGQTAAPTGAFIDVSAGWRNACAIRTGGALVCFGLNDRNQSSPPSGTFTRVSAGMWHACALRSDNTAACWGSNLSGESTPPTGTTFTRVGAGSGYSCGLRTDGTVVCWGSRPTAPTGTFVDLRVGSEHACAMRADGSLECWGGSYWSRIIPPSGDYTDVRLSARYSSESACGLRSDGTTACWLTSSLSPPQLTGVVEAAIGDSHVCGRRSDGTLVCATSSYAITPPPGTFKTIASVANYSCAIRTDDTLACFGATPGAAPSGTFRALALHPYGGCAVTTAGAITCWGAVSYGTPASGTFAKIAIAENHACGIRTDGTVACWGSPSYAGGAPTGTFTAIGAGEQSSCALRTDGTIACWGSTIYGMTSPPSGTFTALSTAAYTTCAVRAGDNALVCWGQTARNLAPVLALSSPFATIKAGTPIAATVVSATGGKSPYTFSVINGTLPAGVTLASDGTVSGTPTTPGTSTFTIRATDADGYVGGRAYSWTVSLGDPAKLAIVAGTPQSATVGTAFATPLEVEVRDAADNIVPSATVSFAAPTTGANATLSAPSIATDTTGHAKITATAGTIAGAYSVTASIPAASVTFALTNLPGAASSLVAAADATPQSAKIETAFAKPLAVLVSDTYGNVVPGVAITYAAPTSGASATLPATTATTDGTGKAELVATANSTSGAYSVTATTGSLSTSFALTNLAGDAGSVVVVSGTPQTTKVSSAFAEPLVVRVTDAKGNAVEGADVTFAAPSSGATGAFGTSSAKTDADGRAQTTVTANAQEGAWTASASVTGGSSPATFALTNEALASTTTLVATPATAKYGDGIVLRATVTTGATGTVTFQEGTTTLGAITLTGSAAELTTSSLSVGTHEVVAHYGGDASYAASDSAKVTITIEAASTDAGATDAGTTEDAAPVDPGTPAAATEPGSGCSCRTSPTVHADRAALLALAIAGLAIARRRARGRAE